MKKIIALFLTITMCLSLCACGGSTEKNTFYAIGDTVSTDTVELTLTSINYVNEYSRCVPTDGKKFVVIGYTVKNIGKTDINTVSNGIASDLRYIPSINYNDGYIFDVDAAENERVDGMLCSSTAFSTPYSADYSDLKPLSDAIECETAICVPAEVVETTENSLSIDMKIPSSNNTPETFSFKVR